MPATAEVRAGAAASTLRPWMVSTMLVALAATALDAFLLQQKRSFFTGGFLSEFHTEGPAQAIAFLTASFLTDAGAAGALVAAAMWLAGRFRLTAHARRAAVLILGLAPFAIHDFVAYRLHTYLGDAFDLSLMFDLTGRSPGEFLAVSSQHLVGPSLFLGGMIVAACGVVWAINRIGPAESASRLRVPLRLFGVAAMALVAASVASVAVRAASETFEDGLRRKPSGSFFGWLTDLATDVDRDGFGISGRMNDPDPFDAAVFPYAVEIPGDGIDQNGVAGDLPGDAPPYKEEAPAAAWISRPDVVLFLLESFRADAFGRTVNGRAVTPVMDRLAREGVGVPVAYSHNGYTAQSRFHVLTGSLAGLRAGSLIDDFKANGYEVGYFSGQDDSFGGAGYGVGMERADVAYDARQDRKLRYSTFSTAGSLAVPAEVVQKRIGEFLTRRDRSRPLFLYVNFHDTHYPYHHEGMRALVSDRVIAEGQIHPSRAAALQEMYFNAAANVDASIGSTLQMVEQHLGRAPAVVVTSDHGESLYDEGFLGHGYALNDVQTRVPLVVRGLPVRLEQPVGQVELRDAIGAAMTRDPGEPPSVTLRPDKTVFQYLGNLDRSRQIGLAGVSGRTLFDLRTGRVQVPGTAWLRPADVAPETRAGLWSLAHLWERMLVARDRDGR